MIDGHWRVDAMWRVVCLAFALALLVVSLGVTADIRTLTATNAELSRYVTVTMDSLEAELADLQAFQQEGIAALRSGQPGAYLAVLERAAGEQ